MTSRTSRAQQNRKRKQLARALALSACLISVAAPAVAKTTYVSTADEFYKATLEGGDGGAFYTKNGSILLSGNDSITFSDNSTKGHRGALSALSIVSLDFNGPIVSRNNTASKYGSAIYASTVNLRSRSSILFEGNSGLWIDSNAVLENGLKLVVVDYSAESEDRWYPVRSADFLTVTGGLTASNDADSKFSFTNISTDYRSADITSKKVNGSTVLTLSRRNADLVYWKNGDNPSGVWAVGGSGSMDWAVNGTYGEMSDRFYIGDSVNFVESADHRTTPSRTVIVIVIVIVSGSIYPEKMNVMSGKQRVQLTFGCKWNLSERRSSFAESSPKSAAALSL